MNAKRAGSNQSTVLEVKAMFHGESVLIIIIILKDYNPHILYRICQVSNDMDLSKVLSWSVAQASSTGTLFVIMRLWRFNS